MKKTLIVLGILLLIIGLGMGGFFLLRGSKKEKAEITPTPTPEIFLKTRLEERPFISLIPSLDGYWLTLSVSRIQKAESLEYELIYQTSNGLMQGAVGGPFALQGETSYEKKILLGTESRGSYRYHEGVKEGSLTVRLDGGRGPRKFSTDFHLQSNVENLSSIDEQFSLEADFSSGQFYLIMPTAGLPEEIEREIEIGPYGVFTSGSKKIKNGEIKIKERENLYYWDEKNWQKIGKTNISETGVFVVLKSE